MVDKNTVQAGEESRFYKAGRDWEADRQTRSEKSERRAWIVAGACSLLALVAVGGMATMAPFKRVVPYVFAVDKATGNVELVSATDDRAAVGYQELTDKHWAQTYVVARESYSWKLLQNDYDTVLALSSDEVGREYAKLYEGGNARDKKFGQSVEMRVKVLSVTLSHDDVSTKAVVRFEKVAKRQEADVADPPQYFVSTMAFEYKPSMFGKEKDLIANPLGYRVVAYRVDAEAATPLPTVKPAAVPQ
ncbi:MAG: virB8 family protein [Roseateles sp.]|uniref:Type IV secretion system protein VirB8 n=1 Tax=Variovorax guangxiensis TaxID=1775474 RepID=A0A3S0ZJY4_9BURK|nr:VirB8/TrbF family protein [Variovorax guangxiensis]RUR71890.1 type IV secretion system protein VirB8 [Variovorax guangxiensis]